MFPRLWTWKELAFVAMIVAFACVAGFLSIKLTRPRPLPHAMLARGIHVGLVNSGTPSARLRNDTNCPDLTDL